MRPKIAPCEKAWSALAGLRRGLQSAPRSTITRPPTMTVGLTRPFNAFSETGICELTRIHASCTQKKYTGRPGEQRDQWHSHRSWSSLGNSGSGKRANLDMRKMLTDGNGKPNAGPNTIARRTAQPSMRRINHGSLKKDLEMSEPRTAATGFVTRELGMYRRAMIILG